MYIEKIAEAVRKHREDIAIGDFVSVVLEVCLQCDAKGVEELNELFIDSEIDMRLYNNAIETVIKDLLKNSDLLDTDK